MPAVPHADRSLITSQIDTAPKLRLVGLEPFRGLITSQIDTAPKLALGARLGPIV